MTNTGVQDFGRFGKLNPAWLSGWPVESRVDPSDFGTRTDRNSAMSDLRWSRVYHNSPDRPVRVSVPDRDGWWRWATVRESRSRWLTTTVPAIPRDKVISTDTPEDDRKRPSDLDANARIIELSVRAGMAWDAISLLVAEDTVLDGEPVDEWVEIDGLRAHHSTGGRFTASYPHGQGVAAIAAWRVERASSGRMNVDTELLGLV